MVKDALDTAEASPIVNEVLGRAEATLVAEPTGGQGAGSRALGAFAMTTFFADEEMAWVKGGRFLRGPLQQLFGLQVACPRLRPDEGVSRVRWRDGPEEVLLRSGSAVGDGAGCAGVAQGLLER